MSATRIIVERLRRRDGQRCWLCHEPIEFDAEPNSSFSPSLEHLLARCLNGPDVDSNLVLCHAKCNRLLGCRPLTHKIKLRERRRKKLWKSALGIKA